MTSTAETIRIALTALMVGIAIPLLAQLFLVLRGVRRTVGVLEQRLDGTLRDLGEVVADLKRVTAPPPASASPALTFASQLAAALPALITAVRTVRAGGASDDSAPEKDEDRQASSKAA